MELRGVRVVRDIDPYPDVAYLEQKGFEERLASYLRGQLHFVAVQIEAEVVLERGVQATIRSPGLGGIESDTAEKDLDPIILEEWDALRRALITMGVSTSALPLEVPDEWIEWRT